jgi:Spy/CpxP family protein refolding chaperone
MKMNSLSMILAGTLLLSGLAMAQDQAPAPPAAPQNPPAVAPAPPQHRPGGMLNLTPDQRKQMQEIRQSARDQFAIVRNDSTLTNDQKKEKLQALHTSTKAQMKAVLTPEQAQTFEKMRANRKANMQARLGLTDDQKAKMKTAMQAARTQRQAVLSNTSLSYSDKASQLKQIRESTMAQMKQILTPDQQQKLRRIRMMRNRRQMRGMRRGPMEM